MFNTWFTLFAVLALIAVLFTAWPMALGIAFVWASFILPFVRMATFETRLARDIAR